MLNEYLIHVDEHNAATMAPHFWIERCFGFAFLCLWIAVLVTSSAKSSSAASLESFISVEESLIYHRVQRSPDEETFQSRNPKKVEDYEIPGDDLIETQVTSLESSSEEVPREDEDEIEENPQLLKDQKNKQHEQKKFNGSDLKKISADTKSLNDSFIEKQKLPLYNPNPAIKYNNSYKKESKINSSSGEYNLKSDGSSLKVPSKFMKKVKGSTDDGVLNVTQPAKVNETRLMSDQPSETDDDTGRNSTDSSDEIADTDIADSFSQNSTSLNEGNSTMPDGRTMPSDEISIVLVSGVTLGTAVLLGVLAGGGFVFYRHRMWNKPQTLSDKCSNADSSGYIDDSTLRENSEEMYSLDNDSFLNSLEAMTIQNYWTDNVKHTKL